MWEETVTALLHTYPLTWALSLKRERKKEEEEKNRLDQ
jgi:hypothetical protein